MQQRKNTSNTKMPLELSHLHLSQSERIVWLLEEMQIPYELKVFYRDPITAHGPPELKSLVNLPSFPLAPRLHHVYSPTSPY